MLHEVRQPCLPSLKPKHRELQAVKSPLTPKRTARYYWTSWYSAAGGLNVFYDSWHEWLMRPRALEGEARLICLPECQLYVLHDAQSSGEQKRLCCPSFTSLQTVLFICFWRWAIAGDCDDIMKTIIMDIYHRLLSETNGSFFYYFDNFWSSGASELCINKEETSVTLEQ